MLSVEQKSVRGQIVCGHLPVQKIAWVPAFAAEMLPHGARTNYLEGQTVTNNANVHKVDDISQGGCRGMAFEDQRGGTRSKLAHVRKEWSRDDRDPALTSAEHEGDGQRSEKNMGTVWF